MTTDPNSRDERSPLLSWTPGEFKQLHSRMYRPGKRPMHETREHRAIAAVEAEIVRIRYLSTNLANAIQNQMNDESPENAAHHDRQVYRASSDFFTCYISMMLKAKDIWPWLELPPTNIEVFDVNLAECIENVKDVLNRVAAKRDRNEKYWVPYAIIFFSYITIYHFFMLLTHHG